MKELIVWVAVNKNGFISMFLGEEPKRNIETGKWEGIFYVNSLLYKDIIKLVEKSNITWACDPFNLQISLK